MNWVPFPYFAVCLQRKKHPTSFIEKNKIKSEDRNFHGHHTGSVEAIKEKRT